EGGFDVGWIAAGEWLQYTVIVASAGSYRVDFRVACAGAGGRFHLEMNGNDVSGPVAVPNTGGWQSWQTMSIVTTLSAGQQTARLVMDSAGALAAVGNIEWIRFTPAAASTPHSGTPALIPGTI